MTAPTHDLPPPMQLFQMMMGHWVAQITSTVAQLGVPDLLAKGPRGSDELASACHANPDALHRLLRAAASVGLLAQPEPRRFALTPLGECLREGAPGSLRDLFIAEMAPGHWLPWGRLTDAVRTGKPTVRETLGMDTWSYYAKHADEGACFARGMGNLSTMVAAEVVAAYDFTRFSQLVDVGGSQGALIAAALRAAPQAKGVLFDLPEVIAAGQKMVAHYELGDRLRTQAGDFLKEVPSGDGYLIKSILHDWDDEHCRTILKTVHRAAQPNAKLLVVEMLLSDSPAATPVKLMDLNMLVMLGGRERTAEEYNALFTQAGWKLDRVLPTHGLFAVIEGTRA
jgi:hypothetical protein